MDFIKDFLGNHLTQCNACSVTKVLATLVVVTIVGYLLKIRNSYNFFKKQGIKTPPYEFLYGNYRELKKKTYSEALQQWTKQLGKTYGYYEGHLPVLVTSDLELIQQIFIKQYNNFSARRRPAIARGEKEGEGHLFTASRLRWKKMRNIMNPTFSSAKLRELGPLISLCSDRLIKVVDNQEEINIYNYYKRFTMDTIWNCAFGVDIDVQNHPDNEYFKRSETVFRNTADLTPIMYLTLYFHELKFFVGNVFMALNRFFLNFGISFSPHGWLFKNVSLIVEKRKQLGAAAAKKRDFVQLLLEAEAFKSENKSDTESDGGGDPSAVHIIKKLSPNEVKTNLILFMLAGYETTSTALTYSTYVLAKYPEEQQKLYDEISAAFSHDSDIKEINTDSVQKLEYLDMFVKEVLRFYPIGNNVVSRECTIPTTINGINFKVNQTVAVDVMSIHFDPELYGPRDPYEFYPARFSPEIKRHPLSFLGFGLGPRNCIGMKFALIELKLGLVKMLLNFEILPPKGGFSEKLEIIEGIVRGPKNGVNVVLKKRVHSD